VDAEPVGPYRTESDGLLDTVGVPDIDADSQRDTDDDADVLKEAELDAVLDTDQEIVE
jgi:hypothetical protein